MAKSKFLFESNKSKIYLRDGYSGPIINDDRSNNYPPYAYKPHHQSFIMEFKYSSVIGISGSEYSVLTTIVPWTDPSGGEMTQFATSGNNVFVRFSENKWQTWGAWRTLL